MCILDKVGRPLVNPPSLKLRRGGPAFLSLRVASERRMRTGNPSLLVSRREDCQERDFDRQRFVNIAIQMIAQSFETPDTFQNFSCAESACQRSGFFACARQAALPHTVTG